MNAKEINQLLKKGFNNLTKEERDGVVKFLGQYSHTQDESTIKNILNGGMLKRHYEQFLETTQKQRSVSNRNIIALALEPIYGAYDEVKENKKSRITPNKGESSDDFIEIWRRMNYEQRNKYMDNLRRKNPSEYRQKSFELDMWKAYRAEVKPNPNQNVTSVSRIRAKNEDGSYIYY